MDMSTFWTENVPNNISEDPNKCNKKYNLSNFVVNYIDDIMIFSTTFEKHLNHIQQLLDAIIEEGFRLKFTKCKFAANSVKYLDHFITEKTVTPLKNNLK